MSGSRDVGTTTGEPKVLTQLYETLVLLDNDVVRKDWKQAKAIVTDTITKYQGDLKACRRWDERRLAYPINRKKRATFFISYFEMDGEQIPGFLRDLELNERVLRSLMVRVDAMPEEELELAAAEDGKDFEVPTPPEDDAIEIPEDELEDGEDGDDDDSGDGPDDDDSDSKRETARAGSKTDDNA